VAASGEIPDLGRLGGAVRILAVSDEVDERLSDDPRTAGPVDLMLACGDLPFEYLNVLQRWLDAPLAFVPGNHDPDVAGYHLSRRGLPVRAGMPATPPWPPGAVNADGRVVDLAGLRLAGLGGSVRYSDGPNQYSQRQQQRRARRVGNAARWRRWRDGRGVDIVLAHSPAAGVGDAPDPAHHGSTALVTLVERLEPPLLLHGHVPPYGPDRADLRIGTTVARNVVGWRRFIFTLRGQVADADHRAS
jgi:hypothetical protein